MIFNLFYFILDSNDIVECKPGWTPAKIADINTALGYHEFANTSRTWCIQLLARSTEKDDLCVLEGANRITFGERRTSFAAAFIEFLSQNIGDELQKYELEIIRSKIFIIIFLMIDKL